MSRKNYILILFLLFFSCIDTIEEVKPELNSRVQFNVTNQEMQGFTFTSEEKLYDWTLYETQPNKIIAPVGEYFYGFVTSSSFTPLDETFQFGETKLNDVMYRIHKNDENKYEFPQPLQSFYTPTAIALNDISQLEVEFEHLVGEVIIEFVTQEDIEELYITVENPTSAVNFKGEAIEEGVGYVKYKMTKTSATTFSGSFYLLPQDQLTLSYDVIYAAGESQRYPMHNSVAVRRNVQTHIKTTFTQRVESEITYSNWESEKDVEYYAGLMVKCDIEGGKPDNYLMAKIWVNKIDEIPNVPSVIDSVPLNYVDGELAFASSLLLPSGLYRLTQIRLYDRDGMLDDPNQRGVGLAQTFSIPGRPISVVLDGRQNEEEFYVRPFIETLHGTAVAGSVYPGAAVYATRCIPEDTPSSSQLEGTEQNRWQQPSPGGTDYAMTVRIINGEWRLVNVGFRGHYRILGGAVTIDYRFEAGNGRMPIDEFEPFLYLEGVEFIGISIQYGNNLNGFAKIRNLNKFGIHNRGVRTAWIYSGDFPLDLANKDMKEFEFSYTNTTDELPDAYSNWRNIEVFHINFNNSLSGPLPASYGNFPKVRLYRFANNRLTGQIPESFTYYSNANVGFNLNRNNFTCGPASFMDRYTRNVVRQRSGTIGACP